MNAPQPIRADLHMRAARWWLSASGARTRTPVPLNTPPKGARVNDATTPEVTAQGLHPAFDAVGQVVALILELEDDLAQIPAGEEMVRRAKKAQATLLAE